MINRISNKELQNVCLVDYNQDREIWNKTSCSMTNKYHLERKLDGTLESSNLKTHTVNVMKLAHLMCKQIGVSEDDTDKILVAAYFHDVSKTGRDASNNHAITSAKMTLDYLKSKNIPIEDAQQIHDIILTHGGNWYKHISHPTTELQKILSFADQIEAQMIINDRPKWGE